MLNLASVPAMRLAGRFGGSGVIINEHTLSQEQTRLHVETLGRWFDFIALDDLPSRLQSPRRKPFCLLTFDDGKRSNATVTAPELERHGAPAAFFLVSGFIDTPKPLWFDQYRALTKQLGMDPAGLSSDIVKRLPHKLLTERLERACRQHGVNVDLNDEDICPMNWDLARDLHGRGFSIGAHGETHAILTRETRSEALASISASIARVSAEIGAPCGSFAFPNGNYTAELAMHATRCGAKIVMNTEPTWVTQALPLWRMPRIQLFGHQGSAEIEAKIALAATGTFLANPDGTGRLYRSIRRMAKGRHKNLVGPINSSQESVTEN